MSGHTSGDVPRQAVPREQVFGLNFWAGDVEQASQQLVNWLREGRYFNVAFANPEFLLESERTPMLVAYLQQCRAVFADGAGIVWASRLQNGRITQRITGTDFQWCIFEMAAQLGLSVFLYGARPGVAERAARQIRERLPAMGTIGCCDGYVPDAEALAHIKAFRPAILMVCLGNPRQESWILRYGQETEATLVFGNGGAMDFISGEVRRAPSWMANNGLEWLWRLMQDFSWTRIRRQARLVRFVGKLMALAVRGR